MSAKPEDAAPASAPPPFTDQIKTVKYSLPELLAELKYERATSILAMEKLHQSDIGNLFQTKQRRRRGKPE
jgi:hypothetical protein